MSAAMLQAKWINPQQASVSLNGTVVPWCKSMMLAGHTLVAAFRLADDCKTDQQRRYYHGVILKQIAQQARPNEQQFPLAAWKEHFRKEYLGFKTVTFTDPMTGKKSRRRVRKSTEDLGVKAYAALIERVTAFAATELGVKFAEQGEYIDTDTGEIYQ
jgi:hypothetical protein